MEYPNLQLFSYFRSSAAHRVRIALNIKQIPYRTTSVQLRSGAQRGSDYLAINPQGLVPALIVDDTVLSQSLAIIEYLDEVYPDQPLLPREPIARAQVRAMAMAIACDIHPLNNLRVLNYLREQLHADEEAVQRWYAHWIASGFSALEAQLGDSRYCHGDTLTLADICLLPQVYNAQRFNCAMQAYPKIVAIAARLANLPAFAAAAPEQQADAE